MSKSRLSHDPARVAADQRAKKFRESIPNQDGEPGGLYALYPRKTIIENMQKLDGAERVYWGWVRYSWCYPISLPYAVEVDADENPIWHAHTGRWLPLSQKRLATLMGIGQSHLSEWTGELGALGRLRVEDGATFVTFTLEIPEEEGRTNGEGYPCTRIAYPFCSPGNPLIGVPKLPKPVLNTLARTFETAKIPLGEERLALAQPFFATQRSLLDTWNQARETAALSFARNFAQLQMDLGLEAEEQTGNGATGQRQDSKETVGAVPKADTHIRNEELYDAGAGKGALAKLDRPRSLPTEPTIAATLLLGLAERGLAVELAFAERLARQMSPCFNTDFFFQVLDNDRAANARVRKPFTTTLLPSVAESVAIKYRDKAKVEDQENQRAEAVRKKEHARDVAQWKDAYRKASAEDRALYAELLTEAGEDVPDLGAGA